MVKIFFQKLLKPFLSILVVVISLEILVRVFLPQNIQPNYRSPAFGIPNALLPNVDLEIIGHRHYPNYRISINNKRIRNRNKITYEKPPGVLRILCLGDSVFFGPGVNFEKLFSSQLQNNLNYKHKNLTYEVINASAPGWGLLEYYNYIKNEGHKYSPDWIIISRFPDDLKQDFSSKINFKRIHAEKLEDEFIKVQLSGMQVLLFKETFLNNFWKFISQKKWYLIISKTSHSLNLFRFRLSTIRAKREREIIKNENSLSNFMWSSNLNLSHKIIWNSKRTPIIINTKNQPTLNINASVKSKVHREANVVLGHLLTQEIIHLSSKIKAKLLILQIPSFAEAVGMTKVQHPTWIFPQTNFVQYLDLLKPYLNFIKNHKEKLFFPFDNHWSPGGHLFFANLLAQIIEAKVPFHDLYKISFKNPNKTSKLVMEIHSANEKIINALKFHKFHLFLEGMHYKAKGNLQKAQKYLYFYLRDNPKHYEVHYQLSLILFELNKYPESLQHLKLSQKGHPLNLPRYQKSYLLVKNYWEGVNYMKLKEYTKALISFKNAENLGVYLERVYMGAATSSRKLGKFKTSEYYYLKAISEKPEWIPYRLVLSMMYIENNHPNKALKQLQKALNIDASNYKTYTLIGMALFKKGDLKKALEMARKALILKPGDPFVLAQIKRWSNSQY